MRINSSQSSTEKTWIVDTGASDHITGCREIFDNLITLIIPIKIGLLDWSLKIVKQIGKIQFSFHIILNEVFFVPDFKQSLMLVSKLLKGNSLTVKFDKE